MKNYNPFRKQRVIAISRESELPIERDLVFERLKPPPSHWFIGAWRVWLKSMRFVPNLFRNPDLARQVSPERPPLPEREWKNQSPNRWYL